MTSEKIEAFVLPLSSPSTAISAPSIVTSAPSTAKSSPHHRPAKHNYIRSELTVFAGEFIGTFMFLFLAFVGTQIALDSVTPTSPENSNPPPSVTKLLYIAFAFGGALAINVAIFADISGGMFNPVVTISLLMIKAIRWERAIHTIFAQLFASIFASLVVSGILPGPLLVVTKLDPDMSIARGLFLEMFLTAQLVLIILMLPASSNKPMYIGLTLFVAEICGVYFTGGSLNPARSFGPAVVAGFTSYQWIYWLGPLLGAGLGGAVFSLFDFLKIDRE